MIHLKCFLLWLVALLLVFDDASAIKVVDGELLLTQERSEAASTRLLRSYKTDSLETSDKKGEERVFGKLLTLAEPEEIFKSLKLLGTTVTELDNKQILEWLRYSKAYQKKHGEYAFSSQQIYYKLRDVMPEAPLAMMMERLKGTSSLEKLAANVQISQFNRWIDDGMHPDDVARMLGITQGEDAHSLGNLVFYEFNVYWAKLRREAH